MRATRRLATTIISWAAIAAAEPRVRVALQVSGHLRELCESNATAGLDNFAPLEALVASFEAYPLNIGCLRGSNAGALLPGVCY